MKRQPKLLTPPSTQSGFTLIESLLAIMIVSILMVGIAPVIVLSVATRVQARRVELGTQAARTYIDGVRSGKITIPKNTVLLEQIGTDPITGEKIFKYDRDEFAEVSPPPALAITDCDATTVRTNQNYRPPLPRSSVPACTTRVRPITLCWPINLIKRSSTVPVEFP